ncbi:hypothetical protein M3Y98_01165900 [Aphelenchoides besseyi]|nr:hypothetical protein M3Y98_01165900 [Aphelenchoides besseyi]
MPVHFHFSRSTEHPSRSFRWLPSDIFHVLLCVLHFSLIWSFQLWFAVCFIRYFKFPLVFLPVASLLIYLVTYFAYWKQWYFLLMFHMVIDSVVAFSYLILGALLLIESSSLPSDEKSALLKGLEIGDTLVLSIYMIVTAIVQFLFIHVILRGYKNGIDLLYWAPDSRELTITLIILFSIYFLGACVWIGIWTGTAR